MTEDYWPLLEQVIKLAYRAGDEILLWYTRDATIETKADGTPVTIADKNSEALIMAELQKLTPDIPVVSEEAFAVGRIPDVGRAFWLVDPLDGTKEFIAHNGEFSVNIGLVVDQQPVLGVVYAPAKNSLYAGVVGQRAIVEENGVRRDIRCRFAPAEGLTVVTSRSHTNESALDTFLAGRKMAEKQHIGSALKMGLIAAGKADLYPRLGRTMEWDTAAGHAILRAAGGEVETIDGQSFLYGKPGFKNGDFLAHGLM